MKRYLFCLGVLALVFWGCAGPPPEYAPPEDLFIQEITEIPGFSKEELFKGAKIWVAKSFSADLDVIQYANREQGVVVGKTSIPHERSSKYGPPDRFELRFTVVAETKDEKIRTTFKDLRLMGGFGIDPLLASDMEVIRPKLEKSIQALAASYEKKSEMEDW